MDHRKEYEKWLGSRHINADERAELQKLDETGIYEAFYKHAEFGTGGMRGIMGPGTNRINRYTIRMAAKAMADMLPEAAKVVVAYDTRNSSRLFAEETAGVFAAAGIRTYLFDRYAPVPLLSFAVRQLGADGGVVITASHNTKEYNGFKTYDETGCQMLPDKTEIIAANMAAVENPFEIETAGIDESVNETGLIIPIGDEIIAEFQDSIAECGRIRSSESNSDSAALKVVYTPLHGSGRDYVKEALRRAGFTDVITVDEQAEFDGDFPTVRKPNPEDPAALELAVRYALDTDADIIIGTDPDCDRVGVGVVHTDPQSGKKSVTCLTGNQTGALITDYLCRTGSPSGKELITTVVTGEMGPVIAAHYGVNIKRVLTGFKYIGDTMNRMEQEGRDEDFLMGYEESYGYLLGRHVRDKDGISTALAICRMAAWHKAQGETLLQALEGLYGRFGYWQDAQESFEKDGAEGAKTMSAVMDALRNKKAELFGCGEYMDFMDCEDELQKADLLRYSFEDGSWVAIRPSGTEPKIKIYYCMCGENAEAAYKRQKAAAECVCKLIGDYK